MERKYAAYVRNDAYGTMGRGSCRRRRRRCWGSRLSPWSRSGWCRRRWCWCCTTSYAGSAPSSPPRTGRTGRKITPTWSGGRKAVVRSGRFLGRVMLFCFGFYWIRETRRGFSDEVECREQADEAERPGVIVSNHVSHLDILYHMSSFFPSFVAKRSVAKLPFVGLISKCLGCVYVQRESKSSEFKGISGVVTERIQEAHQNEHSPMMLLFPEGTTTNGDYLLPFKTGAFLAKVPVRPVILRYPYKRFSPAWDSISGVRHVFLLLCQFVNHLEVTHLPVYYPSEQEKEDPQLYASNVRKLLATEGNLILSDIGLAEKRIYHAALNGNSLPRVFHEKDD
ncbi:putative lysophospholipid acyltransferase LPEAT1 isoform X1 [Iris pallida]|uniref:Lysophospholipid acyltransferase LPEAT1 isoform X1 n=1 Tax=Iris pallida TaxID=29817 RepID=A0AAX6G5B2_IRIPA|nr:putative lysophospholipid acyltransferase LPEAT1 isoform X1 [Iris pallida]